MSTFTIRQGVSRLLQEREHSRQKRHALLDSRLGMPIWAWLALLIALGAVVRVVGYSFTEGMIHPDEIGQYLEPAHRLLERQGIVAWEFQRGGRNWVIAWHYTAVLQFARWFGCEGLSRLHFVRFHDALLSLVIIPACFRMGRALGGSLGSGVLAAAIAALSPTLAYYSCHALAEWHCMIFVTWAYALWFEQAQARDESPSLLGATLVGLLLGGAFVARPNYGVVIPLVVLDYVLRRRYRELFGLLGGILVVVVALGIIDWITWGMPFQSIVVWVDYNIIGGHVSEANTKPFVFYFRNLLFRDYGPALPIVLLAMGVSFKVTWRAVLGWFIPLLVMSALTNKQERFILPIWPCFLVAAAASLIHLREVIARQSSRFLGLPGVGRALAVAPLLVLSFALGSNLVALLHKPWTEKANLFKAQDWVRRQRDLTGLAVIGRWYRSGAYTVVDRHIPLVFDQSTPPTSRIYSHYIALGPVAELAKKSPNWQVIRLFGPYTVFRRRDAWIGSSPSR